MKDLSVKVGKMSSEGEEWREDVGRRVEAVGKKMELLKREVKEGVLAIVDTWSDKIKNMATDMIKNSQDHTIKLIEGSIKEKSI